MYRRTLHRSRRKQELEKITNENLKILNRIENARPTYSHAEWERKAAEDDERMFKLCEYPPESLREQRRARRATCDGYTFRLPSILKEDGR